MRKLLEKVKGLLEKFNSQSKRIKFAVIAASLAVIIAIISGIYYSTSNKYQILFSDLDATDAQTVINTLNDKKIATKIDSSNNTIMVPKDQVDELRLELAPTLTSGSKGYELMDSGSSFGMTDEEFKIKKVRMQQGELEKTIKKIPQVDDVRVHITEAQDSVFVKDKNPGKAAVYLKLKKGTTITEDQVKSIVALVSGATENIPRENIDVIDDKMNLLTKDINSEQSGQVSSEEISKQQDAEKAYEDKLNKAIEGTLEPIVGKGKVKATVNANLDFDSKQKTQTVVDPNKVIVSQENSKQSDNSTAGATSQSPVDNNMSNTTPATNNNNNSTSAKEDQKTNYEVGKTESKVISAPGEVKRLTATVMIDGNLDAATQQTLEDAIGNAIGLDKLRGDQVSVVGMAFDTSLQDQAKAELDAMNAQAATDSKNKMMIIAGVLGAVLLGLIIFLIARRRRKKKVENEQLINTLIDDSIIPKEPDHFDPIEFEVKTQKSHLEDEIKKYATEKPEQVVEIIKSWLTENER
ncbi:MULTISPECIES: flagellar basal-body MS-ring/collar protein FliF [unclassified Clostridium]|uniref:flagellar basal-body MS-ring/collar protein FliF n=1 Tax=unclassified Clostridium TaxID=2614128 RepID=UPI000297CB86|nr:MULTISPECIES: flagellar basal-body MS-ring/collar protein FliF [unclassified Clostridium]EKQ51091.1 MAG: flagellar basal-body M-ring protein/flagellar hook-basal body protein FliF [Clostridium sp. Maddingley MBC34-26]